MRVGRGTPRVCARSSASWVAVVLALMTLATLALAAPALAQTAGGAVLVEGCGSIDQSGSYRISRDITAQASPCLTIQASDVDLDGDGHNLTTSAGSGTGIAIRSDTSTPTNVTVRDVRVEGFSDANLQVEGANGVRLERVSVVAGEGAGLRVLDTEGLTIRASSAEQNAVGIEIRRSSDVHIVSSDANGNGGAGLRLDGVSAARFERGSLTSNAVAAAVDASPGARIADTALRQSASWSIEATGGDRVLLDRVGLLGWRLSGELRDVQLRRTSVPEGPAAPHEALDLHLETVPSTARGFWNLTAHVLEGTIPDYQRPTLEWWRWDGQAWAQAEGTNATDPRAGTVTVNASREGIFAPVVEEDRTPPITVDDAPEGWVNRTVRLQLDATDDLSGVSNTSLRLENGTWRTYEGPVTLEGEGIHRIAYRSTDAAGNREPQRNTTVRIDRSPPSVGAQAEGEDPVTVTIAAADGASGVASIVYRLDGDPWTSYTETLTIEEPGEHTLTYQAHDRAGNRAPTEQLSFRVAAGSDGTGGGSTSPPVEIEVTEPTSHGSDRTARVAVLNVSDPSGVSILLEHPDGQVEELGTGDEATWRTDTYPNGYYEIQAVEQDGGDQATTLASTTYLVENARSSLAEALLAVAVGVFAIAAVQAIVAGTGWLARLLAYVGKVVRRALGIEYRERTKPLATLRARIVREGGAALLAAAVLALAATLAGVEDWLPEALIAHLPTLGAAAVVFSLVWYGGDWLIARGTGQSPRYVLLGSGLLSIAVTTLLLRSPFGTPGYVEKRSSPADEEIDQTAFLAQRTLADLGLIGSAALVFLPAMRSWSYGFGETGLLLVAMTIATGAVPIPPLPNHQVFAWNRLAGAAIFATGVGLYVGWQLALVPDSLLVAIGLAGLAAVGWFISRYRGRGDPPAST